MKVALVSTVAPQANKIAMSVMLLSVPFSVGVGVPW
jgi:hypothetical protein